MRDSEAAPPKVGVFNLNMACAYYACVFDAEFEDLSNAEARPMLIGRTAFTLVQARGGDAAEGLIAPVEDVDVCVARAAAKGGSIVAPAAEHEAHGRAGRVKCPFGHEWLVTPLSIEAAAPQGSE